MNVRFLVRSVVAWVALAAVTIAQNPGAPVPVGTTGLGPTLPEPLTWTVLGMAGVGCAMAARRRKRREQATV